MRWLPSNAVLSWGAVLCSVLPRQATAQTAVADLVFERVIRERWMNAHQSPAFTPWIDSRINLRIAGIDDSTGRRDVRINAYRLQLVTADGHIWPTDQIVVAIDPRGRIVSLVGATAPQPGIYPVPAFSAVSVDSGSVTTSSGALPATLAWDFVPAFHPRRVAVGERWVDTIAWSAAWRGSDQRITGMRTSTIVGDTVVNGVRLWRVRDRMQAMYHERVLAAYSAHGSRLRIDRTATGVVRGEYLYNPVLRLNVVRSDTTDLRGTALLSLPDGRKFTTPARFQRTRSFTSYDAAGYRSHLADIERAEAAEQAAFLPPESLHAANRKPAIVDSLLSEWSRSRDVDHRARLRGVVMNLVSSDVYYGAPFHDRLDRLLLASGDTARVIEELPFSLWGYKPLDTVALKFLLPFFRDQGRAFGLGFTDPGYDDLVEALYFNPTATPVNGGFPPPTRAAREMLGREWHTAKDPRLRDIALMALLTLDPARWSDTVIAREQAGEILLEKAVELIRGQLSHDSSPLPAEGGSWRAWAAWADDGGGMERDSIAPPSLQLGVRYQQVARFVQLRTGRDLLAEWQQQLVTAPDDSARYVFERLLLPFRLWTPPSLDSIATLFRVGNPYNYARATNAIGVAFAMAAQPADSATATDIVEQLLTSLIYGDLAWPTIKPSWDTLPRDTAAGVRDSSRGLAAEPKRTVFVYMDGLPPLARARWSGRVEWISDSSWNVPPERYPASVIAINAIKKAGPFLRLRWTHARYPFVQVEDEEQTTTGDFLLMRTVKGWVIVPDDFFHVAD